MTTFTSITPNLIVRDIEASLRFYRDLLGFTVTMSVPEQAPFVFVGLSRDGVPVFLNDFKTVEADMAGTADRQPGGTAGLFFVVDGVDDLYTAVAARATVLMPIKDQFYGMREFAVEDPDGHLITFAQPIPRSQQSDF
jgi:catechol 2,3-dioxygenase-like lactoylglutathione lyase family enzyme